MRIVCLNSKGFRTMVHSHAMYLCIFYSVLIQKDKSSPAAMQSCQFVPISSFIFIHLQNPYPYCWLTSRWLTFPFLPCRYPGVVDAHPSGGSSPPGPHPRDGPARRRPEPPRHHRRLLRHRATPRTAAGNQVLHLKSIQWFLNYLCRSIFHPALEVCCDTLDSKQYLLELKIKHESAS